MFIRYRDRYGRFISKKSAARRKPKNVISEQIERGKVTARTTGYKVRRFGYRVPARKIRKKFPIIRERRVIRRVIEEIPEEEIEEREEEEIPVEIEEIPEEIEELEGWQDILGEYPEMSGLDELDWIEDNLDEESEWYEE